MTITWQTGAVPSVARIPIGLYFLQFITLGKIRSRTQIKRFTDIIPETNQAIQMLMTIKARLEEAWKYEIEDFDKGILTPASFSERLEGLLFGLSDLLNIDIVAALSLLETNLEIWPIQVSKNIFHDPKVWKSISVNVNNDSGGSTLTVNQDNVVDIMSIFDIRDVLEITSAEDPKHNNLHTIATVTDQVLTFDSPMLGKDNANDETMVITLVER